MRLLACALVALLLPLASAGNARDPEITDPADGTDKAADLLAVWLEPEDEGLRFSIQASAGGVPDHIYWIHFTVRETGEELAALVGYGPDTRLRGHIGRLAGPEYDRGGFERVAKDQLRSLREMPGAPYLWSAVIPWEAAFGLSMGATLDDLTAGTATYDRARGQWRGGVDSARAPAPYVIEAETSFLPILVPAWVIPTIVIGCTVLGLGAGLWIAIATRARSIEAPLRTSAPEPQVRPAGSRFQQAPAKK